MPPLLVTVEPVAATHKKAGSTVRYPNREVYTGTLRIEVERAAYTWNHEGVWLLIGRPRAPRQRP
ncbi:MAG: hypothetical protein ABSA57_18025 [Candidatus Acidiferrales bacterium]